MVSSVQIESFDDVSNWSILGSGGAISAETTDFIEGTQAMRVTRTTPTGSMLARHSNAIAARLSLGGFTIKVDSSTQQPTNMSASMWILANFAPTAISLNIRFFDAAQNSDLIFLRNTSPNVAANVPAYITIEDWTGTLTVTDPVEIGLLDIILSIVPIAQGHTFVVDALVFSRWGKGNRSVNSWTKASKSTSAWSAVSDDATNWTKTGRA